MGVRGVLNLGVKLVKEWVAKSPNKLFTFADMSHRFWCYVGILPKDRDFIPKILKILLYPQNDEEE